MFTLQQIKDAHAKVKSGADFPPYIQELIKLGVIRYKTHVADGHTQFEGNNNFILKSDPKYPVKIISEKSDDEEFTKALKEHQLGKSDYPTFCNLSAQHGVDHWIVDAKRMTCTYYSSSGKQVLQEMIPS
jgi:uncharacterized protein YbcV (DUF1398 family)